MSTVRSFFSRHRSLPPPLPSTTTTTTPPPLPPPSDELARVFAKFDTNGDGRISSSELASIFQTLGYPARPEEVARMMAEADADGDGFISLAEFVDLNTSHLVDPAAALEDLRHAFSVFDLDRNGSISADELARVMRGLGEAASVSQCRRMIKGVDRDGDGKISFDEFKVMMQGSGLAAAVKAAAATGSNKKQ